MKKKVLVFLTFGLFLQSCINTDFINDPITEPEEGQLQILSPGQSLLINESIQLGAVAYNNAEQIVNDVDFMWSSSNNEIISIDQDGVIQAKQKGQILIFVKATGFKTDSTIISVVDNGQQLASINISPNNVTLNKDQTIQFTAQGLTNEGNLLTGINFQWVSSDPSIVAIDNAGLATAQIPGSVEIYATAENLKSPNSIISVNGQKKTGVFSARPGSSYNVSGSVELIENEGALLLVFGDNFQTSNGPDLRIYISPTEKIGSGSIELGKLKSTSGTQSYNVPAESELKDFNYVIIHCVPFNVSFGQAFIM